MVEVQKQGRQTDRVGFGDPRCLGDIDKLLSAFVSKENIAANGSDIEIGKVIGIEITHGTADTLAWTIQSDCGRDVRELPAAVVAKERVAKPPIPNDRSGQEQIEMTILVIIECGDSRAEPLSNTGEQAIVPRRCDIFKSRPTSGLS